MPVGRKVTVQFLVTEPDPLKAIQLVQEALDESDIGPYNNEEIVEFVIWSHADQVLFTEDYEVIGDE
jgi:hypothetical protein